MVMGKSSSETRFFLTVSSRSASEQWQLFDLIADPEERDNQADAHPAVVAEMRKQYDAFVATLPPVKPSAEYSGGGHLPKGWGWEIGNGGNAR